MRKKYDLSALGGYSEIHGINTLATILRSIVQENRAQFLEQVRAELESDAAKLDYSHEDDYFTEAQIDRKRHRATWKNDISTPGLTSHLAGERYFGKALYLPDIYHN
jgi:hypothetical protein